MAYLAEYTADIHHVAGRENVVTDALSRPPGQLPSLPLPGKEGGSNGACSSSPTSTVSNLLPVQSSSGGIIDLAAIAADQHSCSDSTALAATKAMGTTYQARHWRTSASVLHRHRDNQTNCSCQPPPYSLRRRSRPGPPRHQGNTAAHLFALGLEGHVN